jgi:1,4-dihydroxy-6-naphthoate synthase
MRSRRHAQEMEDDVLWKHVELYVNDATSDLGPAGHRALRELERVAREAGLLPNDARSLEVYANPAVQAP